MKSICFDWGDTLMVDFPQYNGPMKDWPEVSLLPGVQDALQTLHTEHDLYVATNASASSVEDVRSALARVEIDSYIQEVFTRHELRAEKPAREFFERLLKNIDDSAAAFVGDHYQKDILGAHHAGMKTFWYNPNFAAAPAHLPLQDAEFSHFSQLADLIKRPLLPGFDTCQVWLLEQPCGFGLLQHNLTVAAIAYQMALWCNENNQAVNTLLVHEF